MKAAVDTVFVYGAASEEAVPEGGSTTCNKGKRLRNTRESSLQIKEMCLAKRTACSHHVTQTTSAVDVCLRKVTSQHRLPFSTLALCIHEGFLNARISEASAALSSTYSPRTRESLWNKLITV